MKSFAKILSGAAGIAMIAGMAAPAAAQSSNYGQYQGYNQGYNQNGGVIGAVINSVLGGGRYGTYGQGRDRVAVDQCARTAEAQVARDHRARGYGNYPQGYPNQAYGQQGYNQPNMARVVGITAVERRPNGVKVSGVIDSGMNRHRGAYGGYANQGYAPQGYAPQGYAPQGYAPQGYAQGYGNNYAQQAQFADLRFSCRVDFRGYVSNVEIRRNNVAQRRGY